MRRPLSRTLALQGLQGAPGALARRARAMPSLDLRFAETKSLTDWISGQNLITFTRASSATVVNAAGALETVASNVPRFDHNPLTGESLGLLVEEQRTNSIRNNTMVGAVAGTPGTLPTNWIYAIGSGGISRDIVGTGTENGINYVDIRFYGTTTNTNSIAIGIDSGTAATGQTWTASLYWKLVGGSLTGITDSNVGLIENTSEGSFVTGAFYAVSNPSSSALSLQRVNATRTLSGGATVGLCVLVLGFNVTNSTAIDFTLRIGLPQLEQGAFATSPILTSGATATRSADFASITEANFSSWASASTHTLFAEIRRSSAVNANTQVASFSDGTLNNRFGLRLDANGITSTLTSVNSGVLDGVVQVATGVAGSNIRQIGAAELNNYQLAVNGEPGTTDTAALVPTVNQFEIGQVTATGYFNGTIRRLTYWPQRLPNNTLIALTR